MSDAQKASALAALVEGGMDIGEAAQASERDGWDPAAAVTVAYVNHNNVGYAWHHSMVELIGYDLARHGRLMQGGYIAIRYGTDGLVDARNKAVEEFLNNRDGQWLFWIDTDMGFPPDIVDRLVEVADPVKRPIVGALAFTQRETHEDGIGGWRCKAAPTVFDWVHVGEQKGFAIRWDYPRNTVTQCAGTGSACVLIHRSVFERIFEKYGAAWYDKSYNHTMKQQTSEDLSFCMRAVSLDIPVFVHTGVKTSHQKTLWVSEEDYLDQQPPPPATEEVAVIVPVMRRPQSAGPFMRSLRASTGLATVFAVADEEDGETIDAWRTAGATVLTMKLDQPGTFAEKVNYAYECISQTPQLVTTAAMTAATASEFAAKFASSTRGAFSTMVLPAEASVTRTAPEPEWLFAVGDDVRFHPGWLDHAMEAAGDRFHVVGTNDLANPRVTSGEHATHMLIRRSYVDDVGASWDGPKAVAHEYRHWFVDDEIVAAAKQRGVWTPALRSVVEHLHPAFGKGENDEVYELGQSFAEQDKATFAARLKENS